MNHQRYLRKASTLLALVTFAVSGTGFAAKAAVGREDATAGEKGVRVPITLTPGAGEKVGGVQFDLVFDEDLLTLREVTVGPAGTEADKSIYFSAVSPGRVRVIIAGLNQNAIPSGVVAYGFFDIAPNASPGEKPISAKGVVLSDPFGNRVPVQAASGAITIGDAGTEKELEHTPSRTDPVGALQTAPRRRLIAIAALCVCAALALGFAGVRVARKTRRHTR